MIEQSLRGPYKRLPDPIANAPDLFPWLTPYYAAFEELVSERHIDGMSGRINPIPWTAIDRYALRHKTGVGRDFGVLLNHIRALDYHHRKLIEAARPKQHDKPAKPPKRQPRPPPRRRK